MIFKKCKGPKVDKISREATLDHGVINGLELDHIDYNHTTSPVRSDSVAKEDVFAWQNVVYDIPYKVQQRRIFDHVTGWVKSGTLTALIGKGNRLAQDLDRKPRSKRSGVRDTYTKKATQNRTTVPGLSPMLSIHIWHSSHRGDTGCSNSWRDSDASLPDVTRVQWYHEATSCLAWIPDLDVASIAIHVLDSRHRLYYTSRKTPPVCRC